MQLAEEQPADDGKLERAAQWHADREQGLGTQPIQELIAKGLHAVTCPLDQNDGSSSPFAATGPRIGRKAKLAYPPSEVTLDNKLDKPLAFTGRRE